MGFINMGAMGFAWRHSFNTEFLSDFFVCWVFYLDDLMVMESRD